jgi:hypothetical protein
LCLVLKLHHQRIDLLHRALLLSKIARGQAQ